MFVVEMTARNLGDSQVLKADALDFLSDSLSYGLSLAVIGASVRVTTGATLMKGVSLPVIGGWVLGSTRCAFFGVDTPKAEVMGVIAVMVAAPVVWVTASSWPDLVVAAGMAGLFT